MASLDFSILDVGHGNCAVLIDGRKVRIVDAPSGNVLVETLEFHKVSEIDAILVSHADADHVAGIITLLLDDRFRVHSVFLNPDAFKETAIWMDFRIALADAEKRFKTVVYTQLTTTTNLPGHNLKIEILAPKPAIAAGGPGSKDLKNRTLTANSMSAVIRVLRNKEPIALLTGDLDEIGLENLLEDKPDLHANVLVYPHHGGRPGSGKPLDFAKRLCEAVRPSIIAFSIGRGKFKTPLLQVIQGVRAAVPDAHIACTQLSEQCARQIGKLRDAHLSNRPARGKHTNACCAGTLIVNLMRSKSLAEPLRKKHLKFIRSQAPTALCVDRPKLNSRISTARR